MFLRTQRMNWSLLLGAIACLFVIRLVSRRRRVPKGLRLPPGPPGRLIFGNASDMPTHHDWETFTHWGKVYGDLVYVRVLNMDMVIVNSAEAAHELFEKRSSLYSDRFDLPMLNLMGFYWNFGIMQYGEWWRRHRKTFNHKFNQTAVVDYQETQTRQTRNFLRRLYESPKDFAKHIRRLSGASIMEISYGIQVLRSDDPLIKNAEQAAAAMSAVGVPGAFLVDTFPILRHLPEWMPGAGFHRTAREWRLPVTQTAIAPFEVVKESWVAGTSVPCVLTSLLEDLCTRSNAPFDDEEVIRNAVGIAYLAGTDTTASTLLVFCIAMVLYPEAQRKAQVELDTVIGMARLPEFSDRKSLPYVNALCKEVLRWHPVAPLGVAHRVTQDDVYGDLFVPQGSVVVGNSWAMLHDEKIFGPQPEEFLPERFLRPGVRDPTFTFGFGRRICPGRYLADNALFIAVASILKVFEFKLARDSNGNEIPVREDFTSGLVAIPEPFECNIRLRSGLEENILSDGLN